MLETDSDPGFGSGRMIEQPDDIKVAAADTLGSGAAE